MPESLETESNVPEVAFYYPGVIWRDPDWLKNLVLFFDGVALLVPEYMRDRPEYLDPAMVTGLEEHGLLRILEPETLVDQAAAETLDRELSRIIDSESLDVLADGPTGFAELSISRLGGGIDPHLGRSLVEKLKERGLALDSQDGVSIPLRPLVRILVLVLLSQILRAAGRAQGLALSPATDIPGVHRALADLLDLPTMPTAGQVVSLDLEVVSVDLSAVALDEALAFRAEHGQEFRAYARDLRATVRALATLDEEERHAVLRDREQGLRDAAASLRETASTKLAKAAKPVGVALGLGGAAWAVVHGEDLLGGLLAGGAALAGAAPGRHPPVATAYSYLLSAGRAFAP